jgi:Pentapeptide repeats (8 copies)
MQHRNWSSKWLLPEGMSRPNLRGARLFHTNLTGAHLGRVDFSNADLTGANLKNADLDMANLSNADLSGANLSSADLSRTNLSNVTLFRADLQNADLSGANLSKASLTQTDLSGARLFQVDLQGASLERAFLNAETVLDESSLSTTICVLSARWNGAPLDKINWLQAPTLGDEPTMESLKETTGKVRAAQYREAARAYHGLVVALREQGLAEPASRYHMREMVMQRNALWQQRNYGGWLLNILLSTVAGYGEKTERALFAYLGVVSLFAALFWLLTNFLHTPGQPSLNIGEAIVLSLSSFHGRGFFTNTIQLGDPLAYAAAFEAVSGLFIELVFIATFSRRFLGD